MIHKSAPSNSHWERGVDRTEVMSDTFKEKAESVIQQSATFRMLKSVKSLSVSCGKKMWRDWCFKTHQLKCSKSFFSHNSIHFKFAFAQYCRWLTFDAIKLINRCKFKTWKHLKSIWELSLPKRPAANQWHHPEVVIDLFWWLLC